VFAGLVDPEQLVATRAIENRETNAPDCGAAAPKNCDVVTYPGASDLYVVTPHPDGSITVQDTTSTVPAPGAPSKGDGTDLLRNVEELKFGDQVGPTTPPGAPRAVTATAVDPDVSVDWTAPLPNGSAAVTGYDITVKDAADGTTVRTVTGVSPTAFNAVISDLPPSRTYTFTVQAVNDFGPGPGVESNPATLAGPPEAPTGLVAVGGKTSATLTWTPGGDGGLPLVDYMVTVWSDGQPVDTITGISASATSYTVTGLVTGQTYTFDVQATNFPYGPGPAATSNAVTLGAVPAAPTGLRATAGNALARLTWTPGDDGGSPITGYELTVRTGATVVRTQHLNGAVRNAVVTGLTNGRAYNFRLQAVNSRGTGPLSAPSNTVTPATRPGQARILAPVRGPAGGLLTAVARWNAPLSTGGAPITSYRVTALRMARNGSVAGSRTVTVSGSTRSRSFTLAAASYRFIVVAVNSAGSGPASARSALVTPR
jgi:predicted RNA-binding protein with TRAM domain